MSSWDIVCPLKMNYIENRKREIMLYSVLWVPFAFTFFLTFDATRWRAAVSRKWFSSRDIVDLFGTEESRNASLNSFWQVRTRCQVAGVRHSTFVALVKNKSLQFQCLKTTDGLARAGYNMTWPVWTFMQSQRYYVFINPFELHWIVTISKYFNMGCVTFRSPCKLLDEKPMLLRMHWENNE
jgi:hypothetical protein